MRHVVQLINKLESLATHPWLSSDYVSVLHDAIATVRNQESLIVELLPYMVDDVRCAMEMGEPPLGHEDDCSDCRWYRQSEEWHRRIEQKEFEQYGL